MLKLKFWFYEMFLFYFIYLPCEWQSQLWPEVYWHKLQHTSNTCEDNSVKDGCTILFLPSENITSKKQNPLAVFHVLDAQLWWWCEVLFEFWGTFERKITMRLNIKLYHYWLWRCTSMTGCYYTDLDHRAQLVYWGPVYCSRTLWYKVDSRPCWSDRALRKMCQQDITVVLQTLQL